MSNAGYKKPSYQYWVRRDDDRPVVPGVCADQEWMKAYYERRKREPKVNGIAILKSC